MLEGLSNRIGTSCRKLRQQIQGTIDRAATLGLEYNYDNLMWQSTLNAHRVAKYAQEAGKGKNIKNGSFTRYSRKTSFFQTMSNSSR